MSALPDELGDAITFVGVIIHIITYFCLFQAHKQLRIFGTFFSYHPFDRS
jgi:hypothetical protein